MLSRTDFETNLLRNTIAAFAAGAGGADSIAVLPHTSPPCSADARAIARNIQHLLSEEAHIHRVDDPAAGSGAIETLTDALAQRAWTEFQTIESEGGILQSLAAGSFQARIAEARASLQNQVATHEVALVGAMPDPFLEVTAAPVAGEGSSALPGLAPVRLEDFVRAA
jgi:methylmalonyl-CoA mutase